MKFNKYFSPTYLLCYAIALYVVGAFLMPHQDVRLLKQLGFAEQEIHTYTDNDGEEHESETLIELYEVGRILTYNDVYLSVIIFFVISLIIARFILNEMYQNNERGGYAPPLLNHLIRASRYFR